MLFTVLCYHVIHHRSILQTLVYVQLHIIRIYDVHLYVIVKALPRVCIKNTARGECRVVNTA